MDGAMEFVGKHKPYQTIAGLEASPEELMSLALDNVRVSLLRAEAAIAAGDKVEKAQALGSAGAVLEFLLGLSGAEPGPLSGRLVKAYGYVMNAVLKANVADDAVAAAAGRAVIDHLSSTWRGIFSGMPDLGAAAGAAPRPRLP